MSIVRNTASVVAIIAAGACSASARDVVQVAGSSTVLPYASIVAEAFGENFDFKTPVVQSGGSSAGLKQFCEGVADNTIDIANSSRPIRPAEVETCKANGVTEIMEVRIGYDGIVFASDRSAQDFAFTPADWYKALAAQTFVDGKLVANTVSSWDQVNPAFKKQEIVAYVPGTKHGTREVFIEKVIQEGCEATGALKAMTDALGKDEALKACTTLRTDGRSVDIDGDYTETLARIQSNKAGIGVFGLSFYEQNTNTLKVATMDGIVPSVESISTGEYPVSRPLFFYVKKQHIGQIPGLLEFAEFFVSDDIAGPGGPLAQYGLVPDPKLADTQAAVASQAVMN
ncbi:phosphonate ABC transporter substrate-binding protein [Haematobacter missouriensis]|uniref:Phosphonate ABC transporter substrate-binding protein n=1 Tax=Haematobacter missouriensis TaxID=366616 RepID=A0A212AJT6_9RHOB|nr:substrate-binding domain-containing protein [Haematobacter missouriensis]KFI32514.1 phosphonate ABC transporter substrate-binding protein [Haematobacter missouriensis]OWJ70246.1 phosphonate ABC transporter substrate-binding protein [Haematobacter missouriensis]OWJ81686.1 phosphonate ABC transporter substrate-binding protein [Haematobacter missouriensis]